MKLDSTMLKQLALTVERKVMTDEVKAMERQIRKLGTKINGINESIEIIGDVSLIHSNIIEQMTELKKVLKANKLL